MLFSKATQRQVHAEITRTAISVLIGERGRDCNRSLCLFLYDVAEIVFTNRQIRANPRLFGS